MVDHLSAGKDLARVLHKSAASALKRAPRTHRVWLYVRVCVFVFVHDCFTRERRAYTVCVLFFLYLSFLSLFLFHVIYFFHRCYTGRE